MIQYSVPKPKVYVETTVVSYLVARPSHDTTLASRQQATQQLWTEYAENFEFVISDIVLNEVSRGDVIAAQRRLEVLADLPVLDVSLDAIILEENLIDAGAVPQRSRPDAQHIALAAVNNIEYLVSWNYKHIVNETKRNLINEVCHVAGFQPTTLCTPIELIEVIQMKEKPDIRMDPVLEECYRMKEEFAAQFKSAQELHDYLKAEQKKFKALGWKYLPPSHLGAEANKKD
ncbi:MAG: type II toxin-antitoxin system VapC family toxin [Candidatus Poribacteria bacterium]|nr:type II toxin-antitoxin system VapC family toxin [Candidatus Poribacteria bacterium]